MKLYGIYEQVGVGWGPCFIPLSTKAVILKLDFRDSLCSFSGVKLVLYKAVTLTRQS